jgi:hypothetical protein
MIPSFRRKPEYLFPCSARRMWFGRARRAAARFRKPGNDGMCIHRADVAKPVDAGDLKIPALNGSPHLNYQS